MTRLVRASALGILIAMLPYAAMATEDAAVETASRALPTGADSTTVAIIAALAVLGILLLATLGYLYRRERHLDWEFQRPDAPHQDAGHH